VDKTLDENHVRERRDALGSEIFEVEAAARKVEHDARIVATEGSRQWSALRKQLELYVIRINQPTDVRVSYCKTQTENEFTLMFALDSRVVKVTFDPSSASISCEGPRHGGVFRPRVEGEALVYGWDPTRVSREVGRLFRADRDDEPQSFTTEQMCGIILRCLTEPKD